MRGHATVVAGPMNQAHSPLPPPPPPPPTRRENKNTRHTFTNPVDPDNIQRGTTDLHLS